MTFPTLLLRYIGDESVVVLWERMEFLEIKATQKKKNNHE